MWWNAFSKQVHEEPMSLQQQYPELQENQQFSKSHQNDCNGSQFPTGTLSFQESQQIKPYDDILMSVSTIKHFLGRIGRKYTLKKKINTSSDAPSSHNVRVNEVMETMTTTSDNKETHQMQHKKQLTKIYWVSSISTFTSCLLTGTI